jgi:hypothetical protein
VTVAIIDPEGLFGGDRLRRCSNVAQLHWPRLFLGSDGFARLENNVIGEVSPAKRRWSGSAHRVTVPEGRGVVCTHPIKDTIVPPLSS